MFSAKLGVREQGVECALKSKVARTVTRVLTLDKLSVVATDRLGLTQARETVLRYPTVGVDSTSLELDVQKLLVLLKGHVVDDRGIGTIVASV